jgi:hypothetical protein
VELRGSDPKAKVKQRHRKEEAESHRCQINKLKLVHSGSNSSDKQCKSDVADQTPRCVGGRVGLLPAPSTACTELRRGARTYARMQGWALMRYFERCRRQFTLLSSHQMVAQIRWRGPRESFECGYCPLLCPFAVPPRRPTSIWSSEDGLRASHLVVPFTLTSRG